MIYATQSQMILKNCARRGGGSEKKKKTGQNGNIWKTWVKTMEFNYRLLAIFLKV